MLAEPGEGKGTSEWKKLKESQMRGLCSTYIYLCWVHVGPI